MPYKFCCFADDKKKFLRTFHETNSKKSFTYLLQTPFKIVILNMEGHKKANSNYFRNCLRFNPNKLCTRIWDFSVWSDPDLEKSCPDLAPV